MWEKLTRLTWSERWLLAEALFALVGARLALTCLRFRRIASWLGTVGVESARFVSPRQNEITQKIRWAIQISARRFPWAHQCLAQALAAHWMTRRRKIPATLYLGVAKDSAQSFMAHAWLRCGNVWVTGGSNRESFQILARFGNNEE
jgi:hypothetical protein